MHEVVSMSLATTGVLRIPGAGVVLADIARTSRPLSAMARPLCLLQLYKEALVLWREGVWINHTVGNKIGDGTLLVADTKESPVNRHANLVNPLSGDGHWFDAFCHHGLADNRAAGGGNTHVLRALDALGGREFFRNLDEELRLLLDVVGIVLRPIVEVL